MDGLLRIHRLYGELLGAHDARRLADVGERIAFALFEQGNFGRRERFAVLPVMMFAAARFVFADLLLEPVAHEVDRGEHRGGPFFGLDEEMPKVEHDVDDLIGALGAHGHVRIEDPVIDVVVEMPDLFFGVLTQRIGDVEVLAFDEYLH